MKIRIVPGPGLALGALVVEKHGARSLHVIVKSTFRLWPDRAATLDEPRPLSAREGYAGGPGTSVVKLDDLAPSKRLCDVVVFGHVHAAGGIPATSAAARVGLWRGSTVVLDKSLHVFGARRSDGSLEPWTVVKLAWEQALGGIGVDANLMGTPHPRIVYPDQRPVPAGFGPISELSPPRRGLLRGRPRPHVTDGILAAPDDLEVDYFQCAPPDQRIPFPTGGEWLVLEGLDPRRARLQCLLPTPASVARVVVPGRPPLPVSLVCDTLAIDADELTLEVTLRGEIAVDFDLDQAFVMALVDAGGEWPDVSAATTTVERAPMGHRTLGATRVLAPMDANFAGEFPAVPFPRSPSPCRELAVLPGAPWNGERLMPVAPAQRHASATMSLGALDLAPPAPRVVPRASPAEPPRAPSPPPPPVFVDREPTPPSRIAMTAASLRELGVPESTIREIAASMHERRG